MQVEYNILITKYRGIKNELYWSLNTQILFREFTMTEIRDILFSDKKAFIYKIIHLI